MAKFDSNKWDDYMERVGGRIIDTRITYKEIDKYTAEEIEEKCCNPVDADQCWKFGERWDRWNGYSFDELLKDDDFPDRYKDLIRKNGSGSGTESDPIIRVRFKSRSQPCGWQRTRFKRDGTCCEFPREPLWYQTATLISPDTEYKFSVRESSSDGPWSWSTAGKGIDITDQGIEAIVEANDCFCDPCLVLAIDGCGQVILHLVYRPDGTWNSITPTALNSPYGWPQDGNPIHILIYGFNDDRTKFSVQSYGSVWSDNKEVIEELAQSMGNYQSETPIAVPSNLGGYEKEGSNVWVKDMQKNPRKVANFHAFYASSTTRYSKEWEFEACEADMEYDENSASGIANNSSASIAWNGGVPPFTVQVSGQELYMDAARTTDTIVTSGRGAVVYSGSTCGMGNVTITDDCGASVSGKLKATSGTWELIDNVWDGSGTQCPGNCESDDGEYKYQDNWCAGTCDTCDDGYGPFEPNCPDEQWPGATTVEGYSIWQWQCIS